MQGNSKQSCSVASLIFSKAKRCINLHRKHKGKSVCVYFYIPDKTTLFITQKSVFKRIWVSFPQLKRNLCSGSHFKGHLHSEHISWCLGSYTLGKLKKKDWKDLLNYNLHGFAPLFLSFSLANSLLCHTLLLSHLLIENC